MRTQHVVGLAALCLPLFFAAGCGNAAPLATSSPTPKPVVLSLQPVLASSDLAVGPNRVVFALLNAQGEPITATAVDVRLAFVQGDTPTPAGTVVAGFRPWPVGTGGVFVAQMDFSQAGKWLAEMTPHDGVAGGEMARLVMPVAERSVTTPLGEMPPASMNPTGSDPAILAKITSDIHPDPDLYAMTIADAERSGKPTVVTFSTPAFCTSRTCGPQMDVVKQLKNDYKAQGNFIHVEIFANPQEMRTDPSKGVVSPEVDQWRLPSDPWTFVLDKQGRVAAKFEGFVSYDELAASFKQALG